MYKHKRKHRLQSLNASRIVVVKTLTKAIANRCEDAIYLLQIQILNEANIQQFGLTGNARTISIPTSGTQNNNLMFHPF